jgi:hypothetical protein
MADEIDDVIFGLQKEKKAHKEKLSQSSFNHRNETHARLMKSKQVRSLKR